MRNLFRSLLIVLTALLLASCAGKTDYRVMERASSELPRPARALVVDFDDERGMETWSHSGWTYVPIFVLWGSYSYDRHDDAYKGIVESFRSWFAKDLQRRLAEARVFDSVEYAPTIEEAERGSYDVIVKGTLLRTQTKGARTRFGLSFIGDLFRDLGVPDQNRRWDLAMRLQLLDGYTFEPIDEAVTVEELTSKKIYNKYGNRQKITDLEPKTTPLWDEYIAYLWDSGPQSGDNLWAEVKQRGEDVLAAERRESEFARRGSPPTFLFLSPTSNEVVRSREIAINWSISAPGGLKTASIAANGAPVALGTTRVDFPSPDSAPVSVPATEIRVPLQMGSNTVTAKVWDHRGNEVEETMSLTRLPAQLTPSARHALLISGGPSGHASVDALAATLKDPFIGQFADSSVFSVKKDQLTREDLESAVRVFSRMPRAGDLVIVYLAADGEWNNLWIGQDGTPLQAFVDLLRQSLATEDVIFMVDVAWQGSGGDRIDSRLSDLPGRWAAVFPKADGGSVAGSGGLTALAGAVVAILRGDAGSGDAQLSLEKFVDDIYAEIYRASSGAVEPRIVGRYNPGITMVARE